MSFLKELRDEAMKCSNELTRYKLRKAADDVQTAMAALQAEPTSANMKTLVGVWTVAHCMLAMVPDSTNNGGAGGAMEAPQEYKLAA